MILGSWGGGVSCKVGDRVRITQVRSQAGRDRTFLGNLRALGLGRISKSRDFTLNEPLIGMIHCASHILRVDKID